MQPLPSHLLARLKTERLFDPIDINQYLVQNATSGWCSVLETTLYAGDIVRLAPHPNAEFPFATVRTLLQDRHTGKIDCVGVQFPQTTQRMHHAFGLNTLPDWFKGWYIAADQITDIIHRHNTTPECTIRELLQPPPPDN